MGEDKYNDWVVNEAKKADWRKDRIILENPESRKELDDLLMEKFYPAITKALKDTSLPYSPISMEDIRIESVFQMPGLGRNFPFFLFDPGYYPILKGDITCSKTGYMFERFFSLGLPRETEPEFLFRILNDPQFRGMMPTLEIYESEINPHWDMYFHISLTAGSGYDFGQYSLYNTAIHLIEDTIKDSVEMYELSMIEGFHSMQEVEDFLKVAYRCFEAC